MNKIRSWRWMFVLTVITSVSGSNGLAVTPKEGTLSATPPANPGISTTPMHSYRTYTYYGDRYRDPFIPLNGDFRTDQSVLDRPPQVAALSLKGIVQDAKGRM